MKILDAHIHLGEDMVFDETQTEDQILSTFSQNGVYGGIVQPFVPRIYVEDTIAAHDRVKRFCDKHPGRFFGMMSMNPHFNGDDYQREAARCLGELGFVGIKITPIAHGCHPGKKAAEKVYEAARAYSVPVMVHTGAGIPFADPISLVKPVESFPDVTFVIAHAGGDMVSAQALFLASRYDNVFLEPSWTAVMNLHNMVRTLGPSKVMFSSDMLENQAVELSKYRSAVEDPAALEQVFSKTAKDVFRLPV